MVVLPVHLDDFSAEVGARRCEDGARIVERAFGESPAAALRLELCPASDLTTYKAEERGCVVAVDPAHTSQRCGRCGHTERANRPKQAASHCRCCGYELHAHLKAARNITWKYHAGTGRTDPDGRLVNAPIVGEAWSHASTHKSLLSESGS